jgi:hypothetical protein
MAPTNEDARPGTPAAAAAAENECDDPAAPNRGDAGVWTVDGQGNSVFSPSQTIFLSIPGNPGYNPNIENTCTEDIPVTHRIVTFNTPRARDLHGKMRINLKSGDATAIELTYNGVGYTIGTDIAVTEAGHSGCGVHDWHTGTETFGFKGKKSGVVVLEAVVDPDPDDGGDGQPNQKLTITVNIIKVTFKPKPKTGANAYAISAKTDWQQQEAVTREQTIGIETDPTGYEDAVVLNVVGFDPQGDQTYSPQGIGTVAKTGAATWKYEAFTEPQAEKRPKQKLVLIGATLYDQALCAQHKIDVSPVWSWLARDAHKHGPDGAEHILPNAADRVADRNQALDYVVWKYQVPIGNIKYGYYLTGEWYDRADAWTNDKHPRYARGVKVYPSAFESENLNASVVGHENVHGGQDFGWFTGSNSDIFFGSFCKRIEYPAYKWEVDNADKNGLSDLEIEGIIKKRDRTKQNRSPSE